MNTNDTTDGIFTQKDTVSNPFDIFSHNIGVDFSQSLSPDIIRVINSLKVGIRTAGLWFIYYLLLANYIAFDLVLLFVISPYYLTISSICHCTVSYW